MRIHLDFSSHRVDLIEEGFDVAFRMGKLEDASFVARKLTEIRKSTLASPRTLRSVVNLNIPNNSPIIAA